MAELITQRIRSNAAELKLHGIAASPDELIDRAEHAQLGYREFLDLILECGVSEPLIERPDLSTQRSGRLCGLVDGR